jgi:AcrR family transcriptional regulator
MEKQIEIAIKAGEMFMKYGIKSVSMDDLSRELGISKKTIYTHFSDKNVLIEYVLKTHMDSIQKSCGFILADCDNAVQELYEFINHAAQNMNSIHPSVIFDLQKYHPNAWKLIEEHEKYFVLPRILDNIKRGRDEGLYREDFNAEIVAQIYVNLNDSIFNRTIKGSTELTLLEIFNESLRFVLFGMATVEGKKYIRKYLVYEK